MPRVQVTAETTVPPDRVLQAAYDFSERRADVFPAVSVKRLEVHELGETSADVTEGTRAGPTVNWERCRYDWSQPNSVVADVTDSNIYEPSGSSWKITASPKDSGSQVEMTWERVFKRGPKGKFFDTVFRRAGNRLFGNYARDILRNLEKLEQAP